VILLVPVYLIVKRKALPHFLVQYLQKTVLSHDFLVDAEGNASAEDIYFEEAVLFYNPTKSRFEAEDYLAALPYEPKKGLSREFLAYFVDFLTQTAESGLDALMDFLADPEVAEFELAPSSAHMAGLPDSPLPQSETWSDYRKVRLPQADPEVAEFELAWNAEAFENGRADLTETDFYPYPRY